MVATVAECGDASQGGRGGRVVKMLGEVHDGSLWWHARSRCMGGLRTGPPFGLPFYMQSLRRTEARRPAPATAAVVAIPPAVTLVSGGRRRSR